jgi:hypothetical protein
LEIDEWINLDKQLRKMLSLERGQSHSKGKQKMTVNRILNKVAYARHLRQSPEAILGPTSQCRN